MEPLLISIVTIALVVVLAIGVCWYIRRLNQRDRPLWRPRLRRRHGLQPGGGGGGLRDVARKVCDDVI